MGLFNKKKTYANKDAVAENGTTAVPKEARNLLGEKKKNENENVDYIGSKDDFNPPDGGWGWVVCIASFWTNGTVFGILNTFGILYVKMLEEFDNGDKDMAFKTSWIGALQITMTFFLSPVASVMVDRFGIRLTGFIGAAVATLGMLLSSFVTTIEVLYLTYGLLLGIGSSLIYNPSLVILGHYFKKHLGVVNGLVSFGSAVFTIILPFIEKYSLEKIGLPNTMRILAGFLSLLMIGSLSWKPKYQMRHTELDHYLSTESMAQRVTGCCRWTKKFLNTSIWKNKGYRIWAISLPISFLGYFIPFVHLVKHTQDVMPGANAEVLVMSIGVTSGVSRLIFGKVADLPHVNRIRMQQISFVILGTATACIPFAKSFWVLIMLTLIMGISDGCFICLIGPIAFDLLGPCGAAQGIGCMLGIASMPMTAGPPLAGYAYDKMGSYDIVFYAAGIPPIFAAILLFMIPAPNVTTKENIPVVTVGESITAMSITNLDKIGNDEAIALRMPYGRLRREEQNTARSLEQLTHGLYGTPVISRLARSVPHLPGTESRMYRGTSSPNTPASTPHHTSIADVTDNHVPHV